MKKSYELPVTTDSVDVIKEIDDFHHQIVSSGKHPDNILNAAINYPEIPIIQTYAAIFYLYAQNNQATKMAGNYLIAAEKNIHQVNLREKLIYQATLSWMKLDYENAIRILKSITKLYPRDTLALKFAEWLYYCTGQVYHAKDYLNVCIPMINVNNNDPYFLSMYSFSLELYGKISDAEKVAEQAITLKLESPWAHHTLAHCYLNTSRIEAGIKKLKTLQPTWKNIFPLLSGHNTWHLALLHLAMRNEKEVMALYPNIFGGLPDICLEQLDAISLLWRLDLAGMPQQQYFNEIVKHVGNYPNEQYTGFNNVHYIYCLTKAGENNHALDSINAMINYAASLHEGYNQKLWQSIIIPFCKGVHAFANENWLTAYELFKPIMADCFQLGGSDAQDELFTQTYLVCLLKLNKKDEAHEFFNATLKHYQETTLGAYWFQQLV